MSCIAYIHIVQYLELYLHIPLVIYIGHILLIIFFLCLINFDICMVIPFTIIVINELCISIVNGKRDEFFVKIGV